MSGPRYFRMREASWLHYLTFLSAALWISAFFPLLFIVLPAVFAHVFLVLFRWNATDDTCLPFSQQEPHSLRSPPL